MDFLILLAVLALLAGPILAIIALVSVRRLDSGASQAQLAELTARIFELEEQIKRLGAATPLRPTGELKPGASPQPRVPGGEVPLAPTLTGAGIPAAGPPPPPAAAPAVPSSREPILRIP